MVMESSLINKSSRIPSYRRIIAVQSKLNSLANRQFVFGVSCSLSEPELNVSSPCFFPPTV